MFHFRETLLHLEPHPVAMYDAIENELPHLEDFVNPTELSDNFAGMTEEQVGELAAHPLFSVGVHTVDHPFLTKCDSEEAFRQIKDNKTWIEEVTNGRCEAIAYPVGEYNREIVEQCRALLV